MIIKASMDKNVTWRSAFDFLIELGFIGDVDIKRVFDKDETLVIDIEIINAQICDELSKLEEDEVYVNVMTSTGIGLFSCKEYNNYNVFIPMNNIIAIKFEDTI